MPKYVLADGDTAATFLAGFNNNSDQAYALVTGVSGGQTIIGSDTTAENLSLRANSADTTSGSVKVLDSLDASSKTAGAFTVAGGLAVAKKLFAGASTLDTLLIGSTANFTDFPAAKEVVSTADSAHTYTGNVAIVGEAKAAAADTGTGVGGVAATNDGQAARGVAGVGKVDASGSAGVAYGGHFRAIDTHAGGNNIAVYGNAANGAANYSFYGAAGNIHNVGDISATVKIHAPTLAGGTVTGGDVTIRPNTADTTTGSVIFSGSLEADSKTNGSAEFAGGVAIAKKLYAGDATVDSLTTAGAVISAKARFTVEGGFAIKAVAGEALVKGEIVSSIQGVGGADGKLFKTPVSGNENDMPLGVVYANADADADVWVITSGIAEVLPQAGDTAARGYVLTASTAAAGRVAQAATAPAAATHFKEVGHWIDTGSGAGVITRAMVHFN